MVTHFLFGYAVRSVVWAARGQGQKGGLQPGVANARRSEQLDLRQVEERVM